MINNTLELENMPHKRGRASGAIRKFANISMKTDEKCRYYWFTHNADNWTGGWSHTLKGCLHCFYSIFVIDRYTGKCWNIGNEPA